jgi:hypothetical protein
MLAWSILRHVPLGRVILWAGVGTVLGSFAGWALTANALFPGLPAIFGGAIEASYRQLDNEDYSSVSYETAQQLDATYSRPWGQVFVGGEVTVGQDVFGESYSRVGAFIRF